MLSRNQIKDITSLHQKKFRNELSLFIAEGRKVVGDLLNSDFKMVELFATEIWMKEQEAAIHKKIAGKFHVVKENELERISALTTPQEVLAVVQMKEQKTDLESLSSSLVFFLDRMNDPGNMGTILRIADWFGIDSVYCSDDSVDCYNPKVVQGSMGSLFRIPVHYVSPDVLFSSAAVRDGLPVFGTFMDGKNIFEEELSANGIIVMGNESDGIRPGIHGLVTRKLSIPRFSSREKSGPDSLNVAAAAAIVAAEFRRQRKS